VDSGVSAAWRRPQGPMDGLDTVDGEAPPRTPPFAEASAGKTNDE